MPSRKTTLRTVRYGIFLGIAAAVLAAPSGIAGADPTAPVSIADAAGLKNSRPVTAPGQQATLLPDGRWLLTGGEIDGEPRNRIAVYSNSQTTLVAATLFSARSGHSATVLTNGTVFIFGGVGPDGQLVQGAEIFDPLQGTVSSQAATGLTARTQHSATLLTNGEILITGGRGASDEALSSVQLWDPLREIALVESSLQVARFAHEAQLLASGEGLVWGGRSATGQALSNGEIYNPNTKLFEGPVERNDSRVVSLSASRGEPPYLADSLPGADAAGVALDSILGVRFSEPLPIAQLNTANIVLVGPSGAVSGSVVGAEGGMLAFFSPAMELRPATTYTLFVTNLADSQGNTLPATSIRFTTQRIVAQAPTVAPSIIRVAPSTDPTAPKATPAARALAAGAVEAAQKPGRRPVVTPSPQPSARPPSASAMAEDWIPQAQNRHGAWRVLGLTNDPPLTTDAHMVPALTAPANQTAVAGQVLRLNGLPLAGVIVSAGTLSTTTDGQGRFVLGGVKAGAVELKVDGTRVVNNGRHYTAHYLFATAQKGTTSVVPYPIYLVRVDPRSEVSISSPADHDITLTHPLMPGLEVTIPKGAVIRDPDGKIVTKISITPIPIDRPPSPVPAIFGVYFTLQPAGAWVDGDATKGVKVIYPNYQGAAAGTPFNFWNDATSENGWHVYGRGRVSPDQTQIWPDDSVTFRRLMQFSAATAPIYIQGSETATAPTPNGCKAADPVDCGTGLFSHTVTDLTVNDVLPITLTRMYRTNDNQVRAFGVGTDLFYDMKLVSPLSSATSDEEIDLVQADGSRVQYFLEGAGCSGRADCYKNTNSPTIFNGSTMWADSRTIFLKNGTVLQFSPNATVSQLSSITDAHGNTVTIMTTAINAEIATAVPVTQVTSPNGRYIQFFYDSFNRIVSAVDNAGRTTSYAYDNLSRLTSATDADGHTEKYSYDPTTNNMSVVTDKRGNTATQNTYDPNGRVSQQQLADGSLWKFSYVLNTAGNVTQATVTDPRGYQRQHTFNSYGYPTQTILALGKPEQQTITTTYNASNSPLQVTDALGRQTVYGYDAFGDLTSITAIAGTASAITYQMTYDPTFHQLTGVTDPLGHTTAITIGASGNTVAVSDALGNTTSAVYNPQGLVTSTIDPLGNATQIGYGTAGNISMVTDPLNRKTQFGQDELGRLIGIIDPLGNSTQFSIDAMDRLTSTINAIGGTTKLTYDQNGNVLTVTDPKNVVQTFTYDKRNRRQTYKDPAGKIETYNYDGMSNLTSKIDRKNQTTSITYDGINRPTLITFQDASTIAITWDGGNRPTKFVDSANGTISRVYNLLDRLIQETTPQGVVNYTYDNASRRQTMTVAGQATINYTFDNDNRLTQVQQGSTVLGFGFDAAGRRTTITLPNTIVGTFGFDNANELTSISYAKGSTTIGTLGYGYDLGSRRTSETGTLAGFVPPTAVPSLAYDGTNRLTTLGGTALSYDANGNITNFGSTTYTWNARNQLTATSGGGATFAYDALGRRVSATVNGVTTPYLYDGQNPAMVSSNQLLAGSGLDEIYAQISSSGTTSYLRDGVNNTVADTNSSAATTANYLYSPYGDTASTGTPSTQLQYTGRENDGATGLYYYRARYYSPQLGRFISEDPLGLGGGANFYAYVNGNPISYRDSSGKDPALALIGAVVGGGYGLINGWIAGDSNAELITDVLAGAASGGIIGLTDGLSLIEGIGGGAIANAEIEALRQFDNSILTHCDKMDVKGIAFAGVTSIFGDLVGAGSSLIRAEAASVANHAIFLPEEFESFAGFISLNVSGLATLPYSAVSRLQH
jgi:RHS repeat-associated protein